MMRIEVLLKVLFCLLSFTIDIYSECHNFVGVRWVNIMFKKRGREASMKKYDQKSTFGVLHLYQDCSA